MKEAYTIKELPDGLRDKFKAACALQNTNMRAAIIWFMQAVAEGKIKVGK